jgi:HEAT repeat protein
MSIATATARLVLEYIQAFIWPVVVVIAVLWVRRPLRRLLERVGQESEEVSASGFGIQFAARFQQTIDDLAKESDVVDAPTLRASVKKAAADLSADQFRALAPNFFGTSQSAREETARAIARLAPGLELDELLSFAISPNTGERVGAAIGLGVLAESSDGVCTDSRVRSTIRQLLDDRNSRVRYRAVKATEACSELTLALAPQLRELADEEPNRFVRKHAQRILATLS